MTSFGNTDFTLEHVHIKNRSVPGIRRSISFLCWHVSPVSYVLYMESSRTSIGRSYSVTRSRSVTSSWVIYIMYERWRVTLYISCTRLSFNILERGSVCCWIRSPYRPLNFPKRQLSFITYPCEKIIEKWHGLRVKQSYMLEEQALAYHMSWEIKTP